MVESTGNGKNWALQRQEEDYFLPNPHLLQIDIAAIFFMGWKQCLKNQRSPEMDNSVFVLIARSELRALKSHFAEILEITPDGELSGMIGVGTALGILCPMEPLNGFCLHLNSHIYIYILIETIPKHCSGN